MYSAEKISELIERRISGLGVKEKPAGLYDPIKYIMGAGGKRIRPLLTVAACEMFGGAAEDALDAAVAVEVFHNFTLLHDDIMDNATTRRGRATVNAKWNDNTAILSGDAMLILAYRLLENSIHLRDVITVFNAMSIGVCEGQQMDMDFESENSVERNEYFRMIRLKTSELIAGALELGAIEAGADKEDRRLVYDFGVSVGTAFQLQDDLLDSFGDAETFGKKVGGDILEGKKTFLVVRFNELADAEDRKKLTALFADRSLTDEEKISRVRALYEKYEIPAECEKEIDSTFSEAMATLNKIQVADGRKDVLREITGRLLKRKR